jgi:DNA invertase Pin-like site-specific DNA recombinase
MRVVVYARGSKDEQELTIDAQRARCAAEVLHRGAEVVEIVEEHIGRGKTGPGLEHALELVGTGRADALMLAKLDRLPRSVASITALMERAQRERWALIILDPAIDMTSPYGRAMAQMAAVFAELERALISARTKEALAVKRADGVRLGRPPAIPRNVEQRIAELLRRGRSPQDIADMLNTERVETVRGGPWTRDTIRRVRSRLAA